MLSVTLESITALLYSHAVRIISAKPAVTVMACSHRRRGRDKTVLSCRVGSVNTTGDQTRQFCLVCSCVHTADADENSSKLGRDETKLSCQRFEHNWRPDKTVLSCLQLCSHHQLDKSRQFCLVSNCVHTADADKTKLGRDETKLSCQRFEHNWRHRQNCLIIVSAM